MSCQCAKCVKQARRYPGVAADPHKYDYLHAEDETAWRFDLWCQCDLCEVKREQMRQEMRKNNG